MPSFMLSASAPAWFPALASLNDGLWPLEDQYVLLTTYPLNHFSSPEFLVLKDGHSLVISLQTLERGNRVIIRGKRDKGR